LRGDDLYLEFRNKLTRLHPYKVVEVLRRMPFEADANDDWIIGQFHAAPLERAAMGQLSDEELARADWIWRAHWVEVEEMARESQRRRTMFFLDEATAYAQHRIQFALPLTGFLGARIAEAAVAFNDSRGDVYKRENLMGKFAREMKAVSAD